MGTTTHSDSEVTVALQGTLDTFALPDVLRLLAATKKTGRLRITGGRGTGSVWVMAGQVVGVEATHAPHATGAVDALFELLRFQEGAFTFDAEATHDDPGPATDVEHLLMQSEAMLDEWRSIEAVVPSMDAWVTLRGELSAPGVTIDQEQWTTIVAVGAGATVRRIGDELCLAELPISRAIKDLIEVGLVDIGEAPPAGLTVMSNGSTPVVDRPLLAPRAAADEPPAAATGPRARRAKAAESAPAEPHVFVPLDLPGHLGGTASAAPGTAVADPPVVLEDPAVAFPGLASHGAAASEDDEDDDDVGKQLATLSPRAANAIRAAAEATTDEERDAALEIVEDEDQPLNRGLLLKFLSSVKT